MDTIVQEHRGKGNYVTEIQSKGCLQVYMWCSSWDLRSSYLKCYREASL